MDYILEKLNVLINKSKDNYKDIQKTTIDQAWKILQIATAEIIQAIELSRPEYAGKDKKTIAMDCISKFYDSVFVIVDIPFVPSVLQPIIHKYIKAFLMLLISSTIDAMVVTFRNAGIFKMPTPDTANN